MFNFLNEKIKRLTVVDISFVKLSSFFFVVIIVKLIPTLLSINYIMLIVLTVACGAKPFYTVWIKK
jgi:hypothetical protein